MQKPSNPNATWEIAVPNGTYTVRIVSGDPTGYGDATFKINVENVLALEGSPTSDNHWFDQTAVVQVSDGKLTVSNATGSNNNKIDFIEISSGPGAYDESYSYDTIGNITGKAGVSYTYPAGGSARPHTPLTVGGAAYSYDGNGNLLSGGGRSYTWNVDNKPTAITGPDGVTEGYNYDADGERVSRSRSGTTTYYFGGMWEEDSTGTIRALYSFSGKVVATRQRVSGVDTVSYLHGDHLGSVSLATSNTGTVANQQEFDPWGKVRLGGMSQTTLNYTGQKLDGTGLLYYHARYYDPGLGKFVSSDNVIPKAENPQTLNRYTYVINSPVKLNDPSGHCAYLPDGSGNRDTSTRERADCWASFDKVNAHSHLRARVNGLDTAWDTAGDYEVLFYWLEHGIVFTSQDYDANRPGAAWNPNEIEQAITAVSDAARFLGEGRYRQALGIANGGTLTFNKYFDAGEAALGRSGGVTTVPTNTINFQWGGGGNRTRELVHELGHIVDGNAGKRDGFVPQGPGRDWWSDNHGIDREDYANAFRRMVYGDSGAVDGKDLVVDIHERAAVNDSLQGPGW